VAIVKLFGNLEDASEDKNFTLVDCGCVAGSRRRALTRGRFKIGPGASSDIKLPEVAKLAIFVILATKDEHGGAMERGRVTGARLGSRSTCIAGLHDGPLVRLEVEHAHYIAASAVLKTTKDKHLGAIDNSCMFIDLRRQVLTIVCLSTCLNGVPVECL